MPARLFTALLHQEGDLYVAYCPETGVTSQGCTLDEAVLNLKEATELHLEEFPLLETGRIFLTMFEATYSA